VVVTTTDPPPICLSLPLLTGLANFPAGNLVVGIPSGVGMILPVSAAPATAETAPAVLPPAGKAAPLAMPTAVLPDLTCGTEKSGPVQNTLLKNLSPVPPGAAANLAAGLNPVSEKAATVAEANAVPPNLAAPTGLNSVPLPAGIDAPGKNDLNSLVVPERVAENAGTGVATTVLPMKNSPNLNKVAGLDVKILPVGETEDAPENNLPPTLLVTPVRTADNPGVDLNSTFSNGSAPVADNATVLNTVDLPSLADARLRALDRAHDMMSLHSMRLVESQGDALSVVIKPAVGTELSLELKQRAGGVEAHATLTRGDHQFLSQHWPELQQRLELRGIKLAPLSAEAGFSAADNGGFQRQQTAHEDAAQQASAFAEFASLGQAGGATARLAVHDGWESWA